MCRSHFGPDGQALALGDGKAKQFHPNPPSKMPRTISGGRIKLLPPEFTM